MARHRAPRSLRNPRAPSAARRSRLHAASLAASQPEGGGGGRACMDEEHGETGPLLCRVVVSRRKRECQMQDDLNGDESEQDRDEAAFAVEEPARSKRREDHDARPQRRARMNARDRPVAERCQRCRDDAEAERPCPEDAAGRAQRCGGHSASASSWLRCLRRVRITFTRIARAATIPSAAAR